MKTVLITGTSTGIGRASANLFAARGWTVFAGSRHPEDLSFEHPKVRPVRIDVNDPASIAACFEEMRRRGATLDCVINNAGYGLMLPFADTTREDIESMFRTNVLGLMEVCKQAMTAMCTNRSGVIINISSVIGQVGAPFYTAYAASKFAVEGFSESLWHEMKPFGVRVKIVEPGPTKTEFHHTAYDIGGRDVSPSFRGIYEKKRATHDAAAANYTPAEDVAEIIYQAATDGSWKLRYPAGATTKHVLFGKKWLPEGYFLRKLGERFVGKWGK